MKNIRSILVIVFTLAAGFVTLQAQKGHDRQIDPAAKAQKQTERMTEALSLDETQAEKIKEINLKYAKLHQQKRTQAAKDKEGAREEYRQMRKQKMTEIKNVLSEAQYAKLQQLRKEKARHRAGHRGKGNNDPEKRAAMMTDRMVEKLGLNKEQEDKVRRINIDFAKQMSALQGKDGHDRSVVKKLREERKNALLEVLTPEQEAELKKMAKKKKKGHRERINQNGKRM